MGFLSEFLKFFAIEYSSKSAKRHVRLFTNKNKDLNSNELTYFEEVTSIRGNMKP